MTRDELLACAKREAAMRRAVYPSRVNAGKMTQGEANHEIEAMGAIVAMLEAYPLASPAAVAVRIVCDDLAERGGFSEVVAKMGPADWREVRAFLEAKVAQSVVYAQPAKRETTMDLEFS